MSEDKINRIKERLGRLYKAEENALEMQSTSNAEGEAQAYASLSTIQKSIKDLESQLEYLEQSDKGIATMYWSFDQ